MAADTHAPANFKFLEYGGVFIAIAVVGILIMLVIPLPTFLLDILLTLNISFGLLVLLIAMYIQKPLEFAIFPSLLLMVTLFRLALNVATTRLILMDGYAGKVVNAFGTFVVGGNYVVGFVIFIILVIIQFVVITNGAQRVAEVAARFTLDAMPGKQMAIDADLNAGLIDEKEARTRRQQISAEADFFGAMDGSTKFVKGDAIASIIIVVVNVLGGFIVGMVQQGMPLTAALQKYTLLTVGDGLVTQIPALIISTATGVIVTKGATATDMGQDIARQIVSSPRALLITSIALVFFGMIPGLPKLPFFILAAVLGYAAYRLNVATKQAALEKEETAARATTETKEPEKVDKLTQADIMEIEIGYGLIPLVDAKQGGDVLDRVTMIRRQCAIDLGIIVPPIRIRDNMQLKTNTYAIKIKGAAVAEGELWVKHYLAMDPGTVKKKIAGKETKEPTFGLPAIWVPERQKEEAEAAGYTVVDASSVLATHLTETIKRSAADIISRQDVRKLLDTVKAEHPAVVEEITPAVLTLGEIQRVLQNLLAERVPIKNLVSILETLADYGRTTRDTDVLTEYVREALSRTLMELYCTDGNTLQILVFDGELEQKLVGSLAQLENGATHLVIEPKVFSALLKILSADIHKLVATGLAPILLCSPKIRLHLRRLLASRLPDLAVISYNEVRSGVEVKTIEIIKV
jgi:flagellar biosynthesis protein FlhA